jgi:hypothetical protein
MPTGETVDALGEQLGQRVAHFARLPLLDEAAREPVDRIVPTLGGFQQDGAPPSDWRVVDRRRQ